MIAQPDDLSLIFGFVDHLYFDTQMTKKYSTAMCNALHCWWSQYEDDHHRTMLLSLSKSGRRDICSFAPIFLRYKLNVMYKNWFQIFAQWTKPGRTSYFEVWCLKFTNNATEAKGELTRLLLHAAATLTLHDSLVVSKKNVWWSTFGGFFLVGWPFLTSIGSQ